jgi:Carboxypeptidase regulatory-like domain
MLLIACALLVWAAQLPPTVPRPRDAIARDTTATPAATGIIRGRVTDRESGEPLARVIVIMVSKAVEGDSRPVQRVGDRTEPRVTLTGADGRFEFKQTLAGAYVVIFDPTPLRGTHLRQSFGETEPTNELSGSRPPPVQLADGEIRNDVNAALSRALAIEGRVLDEFGDPMANVAVSVHPWEGPIDANMVDPRSTDDRGAYRLFGLKPGQYRICARPEVYFPMTEDLRERPIPTCYPAARSESEADPIVLASADVGGIDIRVQHNRAFKISGMALDAAGAPVERAEINLVAVGKSVLSSHGIETLPGGYFVARAVTPGDYAIQVEIGSRYNPEDKRERELGYLPIRVDAGDVEGVVVTTTRLARVAGRIVFEDGAPAGSESIRVAATPPATVGRISSGPSPTAEVRADSTFELTGLFGPQIITIAGQPREWIVKSVTYRGDDVTDVPIEFKTRTDPAALEITMTKRGAIVSGRLLDAAGNGTEAGYVLLISADPARRRSGFGIVATATPKTDGAFTLGPVRHGEYVVLAASGEAMMHLSYPDGESLERLVHEGERIVLVENEKRSIDVRVVKR